MATQNMNFELAKIRTLSPIDAKTYITKFFVPLSNGSHAMLIDEVYVIKDDQEIKRAYFNRMQKELCNYYFKEHTDVRSVVYNINKPVFFDDKINLCPRTMWQISSTYAIDTDTQVKLNIWLVYLKEILCSHSNECYQFLLRWLANMCKGNKNNSCLYLKGMQGTGKSTLFNFMSTHVLGTQLCLETGSDPIRTKFNEILGGKLLVCIEELENFSKGEWESISSTLKRMITSTNITLQNKCTKAYESTNMNNYILCSNNDAIKDDDGRRYFILDIATHRVGDVNYYNRLYSSCFNDKVGEAFFHYLHSISTEGFNPQTFPMTNAKRDSLTKRLDVVYKFLKTEYLLAKRDINCAAVDLFDEFKCRSFSKLPKEDFHRKMTEAGFVKTKHKQKNRYWYTISNEKLHECAKKKLWLNEYDEFVSDIFDSALDTYEPELIEPFTDDEDDEDESPKTSKQKLRKFTSSVKKASAYY